MNLEAHNIFRIKNMILFAKDSLSFKEVLNWYLLKRLMPCVKRKINWTWYFPNKDNPPLIRICSVQKFQFL